MPLTQQQLDYAIKLPVPQIIKLIEDGTITFPDDLKKYHDHPKFKEISDRYASMPDPAAITKYADIKKRIEADPADPMLPAMISGFVAQYGNVQPLKEQVTELRNHLVAVTSSIESTDWDNVDKTSIHDLMTHRRKYAATIHEAEIDNTVWMLLDHSRRSDIENYRREFQSGLHRAEADNILDALELWNSVSTDPDLVTLADYIAEEIMSPFYNDALRLFESLKHEELEKMKSDPGKYKPKELNMLLDNGIFTTADLFEAGVATPHTLQLLNKRLDLPVIEQTSLPTYESLPNSTDVFLFGIPSSGKTCVLTGLLGASEFSYDNSTTGGSYADDLTMYREHKKAPERTFGNFVAQIPGEIRPAADLNMPVFPVNLIEMSGEEFAMKIAYNAENILDFESMGTGATQILTSKNPKVIFIIIDPSANGLIRLATQRADGSSQTKIVQQDIVINKIINMLGKNPDVLRHTNAIHFIMTKADSIGPRETRDDIAVERIRSLYSSAIAKLKELSQKYSINVTSNYSSLLFTFSLGKFYVGNFYDYDPTDADKIIRALMSMVQGKKEKSFFDLLKSKVN